MSEETTTETTTESVGASIGIKKNLGNYESLNLSAWRTTTVGPKETPEEAFDRVWAEVDAELEEKLKELDD